MTLRDAESEAKRAAEDQLVIETMATLGAEGSFTEAFWELLVGIVHQTQSHAACLGRKSQDDPEEAAASFLMHLAGASPALREGLDSGASLERALRQWAVQKADPQGKELWDVLSEALLALESEGRVERAASFRRFNNSNETPWFLPGQGGCQAIRPDRNKLALHMPKIAAKGEKDRVLKPLEARQMVLALLGLAGGPLAMREILSLIKMQVPLLRIMAAPGDGGDNKDDGTGPAFDAPDQGGILAEHQAAIAGEISFAVEAIWTAAGKIVRGTDTKIYGRNILCCYWIPDRVVGRCDKRLEDFGPTSTVHDVVKNLTAIMAAHVPFPDPTCDTDSDRLACRLVAGGIVEELSRLCSENGFCRAFYEQWSLQAEAPDLHHQQSAARSVLP